MWFSATAGPQAVYEAITGVPVSYTHLRAHETVLDLVCRLLLETKNNENTHGVTSIRYRRQAKEAYYNVDSKLYKRDRE